MLQFKQLSISFPLRRLFLIVVILLLTVISLPIKTRAETIGVGVGTGRIVLDDPVKPSLEYELPSIAVFNNGDVESDYEMTVQYNETQPEQKPPSGWVNFSPSTFKLGPGDVQQIVITLHPPYDAMPGDYFAYLEARPVKKDESGSTAIAVAAATKFSFKVIPANFLMRIYYAVLAFWITYKLIIIPVVAALIIVIIVLLAKKYLKVEVKRKKPKDSSDDS